MNFAIIRPVVNPPDDYKSEFMILGYSGTYLHFVRRFFSDENKVLNCSLVEMDGSLRIDKEQFCKLVKKHRKKVFHILVGEKSTGYTVVFS
jgi:hypothetical protein